MKTWKEFSFVVNGFPVQARYTEENIKEIFVPMVRRLDRMQREKGERLVVFLAAPPATGKSTLAAFLAGLSQSFPVCRFKLWGWMAFTIIRIIF